MSSDDVVALMRDTVLLLGKRASVDPKGVDVSIKVDGISNLITADATIHFRNHTRGVTVSGASVYEALTRLREWKP